MADEELHNVYIPINVEEDSSSKFWIAKDSPKKMVHNGRTVLYQQLRFGSAGGIRRSMVIVPGYLISTSYNAKHKEKDVTAFKIERINDESDRKDIEEFLENDLSLSGYATLWSRERTQEEKEQDAIESEKLRKKAKVAEEYLLKAMRDNPNVRKFVEGFANYLHKENNRMHI